MKVVGIKEVNYTSKKTGKEVNGVEIHGVYPSSRCKLGMLTDSQYLSMQIIKEHNNKLPNIGDEVEFFYNKFGQVERYEVVSERS